ncbi:protein of unknown function (plasmid) [Cupriavidus neocaledonicus]|uniref:Uncharacterized protein n=1 Tax=Cupriavidus neocaledonicus TaxID=1040979 RepID=A0A375HS55_9BURK|nr:hypothetical protein CBM2605_B40006 [Cupriavidus neocaledonicus]SPD60999.1 protein of unknown function [Cupriavidus neocaledonicus]
MARGIGHSCHPGQHGAIRKTARRRDLGRAAYEVVLMRIAPHHPQLLDSPARVAVTRSCGLSLKIAGTDLFDLEQGHGRGPPPGYWLVFLLLLSSLNRNFDNSGSGFP